MSNTSVPQSLPHGFVLQGKRNAYIIDCPLGQGAFGITYLAKYRSVVQGEMGRGSAWIQVCVKEFFMRELSSREESTGSLHEATGNSLVSRYRKAFLREANNLARMQHPNIVNVFEVIEANNTAYIVMEYIDGGNLDDYIARKGRLSEDEALRLFQPICDAMSYMHAQRMLHLDLKPKNVMLDEEGKPYLIDFGLSKQYTPDGEPESSTSIGLGTPGYAPSEQAEQRDGDNSFRATIDVYALGGTLYKMLTGKTPPKASEILNDDELLSTNLQKAGVSDKTIKVVEKSMKPASRKRYQSVVDLMEVLGQSPGTIIEDTITERNEDEETFITAKDNEKKEDEVQKAIPLPPNSTFPKWLLPAIAGVVALVITFLSLRSCGKEEPTPIQANTSEQQSNPTSMPLPTNHNDHEYVDLGLSVMWATCNVGATEPEEYGSYYAWGETTTKSEYSWSTLKYLKSGSSENNVVFSKYGNNDANNDIITLDFSDDAANINWGGSWRTPTDVEWTELAERCIWTWIKWGDCYGYKVTSKSNGQFIFLPAAGCRFDTKEKKEILGYYMSSSLCENDAKKVWYMRFNTKAFRKDDGYRYYGYSVRPVCFPFSSNVESEERKEEVEEKYGSLKVTSEPSGAAIYVDGKRIAGKTTPELLEDLTPGSHQIRIMLEGYESQTKNVTIVEEKRSNLSFTLKEKETPVQVSDKERFGSLKVTSDPPGAAIYLDGDNLPGKTTPEYLENLTPGSHIVRLRLEGYESEIKNVTIAEGKRSDLTFELKEMKVSTPDPQTQQITSAHSGTSYTYVFGIDEFRLLQNDLTANMEGTKEIDQNGDVAALIKVVTPETGFVFDVGMLGVVKVLQKVGEIWVYVPHGVQRISIRHQKLGRLESYYFPIPIQEARTYEIKLSTVRIE